MRVSILYLGKIGAGPRYAFEMANALKEKKDVILQIILSESIDNKAHWDEIANTSSVIIKYVKTYHTKFELVLSLLNFVKLKAIARTINDFGPSYLYLPMISLLNPGILFFLKNIKIYYTLHDPIEHVGEANFFVDLIKKYEIKKADKVILLNNFFKDYVVKHYKKKSCDILIIPHAAFFSTGKIIENKQFFKKILFVGRIEEYKGIGLLLESFETVLQRIPNLNLTIAGRGDLKTYLSKISQLSKNLVVDNRWFTDQEIEELIQSHDFVILPYIDASQSGVVPVVFANKRTLIVTNKGALSEQVPQGAGFVVNATKEDIAQKILEIYNSDYEQLLKMGRNAYKYASESLTWQASADILIKDFKGNNE